jgi:hypothetical protein
MGDLSLFSSTSFGIRGEKPLIKQNLLIDWNFGEMPETWGIVTREIVFGLFVN